MGRSALKVRRSLDKVAHAAVGVILCWGALASSWLLSGIGASEMVGAPSFCL